MWMSLSTQARAETQRKQLNKSRAFTRIHQADETPPKARAEQQWNKKYGYLKEINYDFRSVGAYVDLGANIFYSDPLYDKTATVFNMAQGAILPPPDLNCEIRNWNSKDIPIPYPTENLELPLSVKKDSETRQFVQFRYG